MENVETEYFFYFIIFIVANIMLFIFYRFYESNLKNQALLDRLDSVFSLNHSSERDGAKRKLFGPKNKAEGLLERKINAILSKRTTTDQPLQLFLYRCGIKTPASNILLILIGSWFLINLFVSLVLSYELIHSIIISLVATIFLFYNYLNRLGNKYKQAIITNLPQAVEIVLRGIRSGSSIEKTFEVVARESPSPLKEEFEGILKEIEFGVPYDRVLVTSANRVDLNEYYFFVTALIIQRQSGGSLSDVLENILYVLYKTSEMRTKIKVISSEGRLSGIVLGLLPVCLALFLWKVHPDHLTFFYYDPMGNKMLYFILGFFFLAYLSIKKIVNIKV